MAVPASWRQISTSNHLKGFKVYETWPVKSIISSYAIMNFIFVFIKTLMKSSLFITVITIIELNCKNWSDIRQSNHFVSFLKMFKSTNSIYTELNLSLLRPEFVKRLKRIFVYILLALASLIICWVCIVGAQIAQQSLCITRIIYTRNV